MFINVLSFLGFIILLGGFLFILSLVVTDIIIIFKKIYHSVKEYLINEDSTDGS